MDRKLYVHQEEQKAVCSMLIMSSLNSQLTRLKRQ